MNLFEKQQFIRYALPILENKKVQEMAKFPQHGQTPTLCHMVAVAYYAYTCAVRLEKRFPLHLDKKSLVRAALLHDFYLYDWHDHTGNHKLHGFTHPYTACKTAKQYFALNAKEENAILRHMFPFTPIPPRYKESLLLCYADKISSAKETLLRRENLGPCTVCPLHKEGCPVC